MSAFACMDARGLMTRRRLGLEEPDRLRLEQHLEGCAECRFDAAVMDGVAGAVTEASVESRADRALARALRTEPHAVTPQRSMRGAAWMTAAAAAILIVTGAIWLDGREPEVAKREAPPRGGHIVTTRPTRIHVAHAIVRASADTEIEWHGATVALVRGEVSVDVDPRPRAPFRVRTERFDVEVTGTSFEVTPERVRVHRGSVRIVSRAGALLDPRVSAGEEWPEARAPEPRAPEHRAEAEASPSAPEVRAERTPARSSRALEARSEAIDARARFEAAVRSESSQPDAALAQYRAIEREGGAWAPNAMFARGRLLHELARHDEARAVLAQYLARYPRGPNADDARQLYTP